MKKFLFLLGSIFLPAAGTAFDWDGDIAFTTGYRLDEIKTRVKAFDPPGTLVLQNNLKGKDLDIWQVGLKGRIDFCRRFVLKGFADFGWVTNGKYRETAAFPIITSQFSRGSIHDGKTRDYSLGLGYYFNLNSCLPCIQCFRMAPFVGYSYDYQKIKMNHVRTDGLEDPILDGLSYDMRWQGGWVGFESDFWYCCVLFRFGYEYHFTDWRAHWLLRGEDIPGVAFSDKRKSDDASGNVVYIEGNYLFRKCWDLGLSLKYQCWEAERGHLRPTAGSFADIGLSDTEVDKVPRATWDSFQVQLSIGYNF